MNDSPAISPTAGPTSGRSTVSLAISVVTHVVLLALLLALGLFSNATPGDADQFADRPGGIVLTEVLSDQTTEYLDASDIEQLDSTTSESAADPVAEMAMAEAPAMEIPDLPDLPGLPPVESPTFDATTMSAAPSTNQARVSVEVPKSLLDAMAADRKFFESRKPKGDPTSISLFEGGGMRGRRFVFVVDRSYSMGSDGLGVLDRARRELTTAINGLQENHEFQIVAYHNKTVVISERRLLPATPENKQKVSAFFENVGAFGATNHFYGLLSGLDFQPDVLVLLTDGGSPDLTPSERSRLNRMARTAKAEVHCIQFGIGPLQQQTNFMKTLARENNGSYRYIDVNQWR